MALTNAYVLPINRVPDLFRKIQDGQAPERFTNQLLQDAGFKSTNDRAFIPLLKALGFLTVDGVPTPRYLDYRDHSRSKRILGEGIKDAYKDLFLIREHPTPSDKTAIQGKFKSYHNVSDHVANLMTKTFFSLLPLADLSERSPNLSVPSDNAHKPPDEEKGKTQAHQPKFFPGAGLHYNIQIHLPATKDTEVYSAIFKSLKEHLLD